MSRPAQADRLARALLGGTLLLAALLAWLASAPPAVRPTNAPAVAFSAARAMADVRLIGRVAHPAGSAGHDRVAARLIARMAALGLAPRIVAGRAVKVKAGDRANGGGTAVSGADTANLIGTLAGTDRRAPALLLMAHYDSVPSSPGAADDGAGVAAALEIVRALRAAGPPRRDVTLLLSDAEEDGLLGARAFFAGADARRIGFVLNMDMRGGGGRAIMHETGRGSGGAIAAYRASAIHPTTDSIAPFVERLIRNSSDFRIAVDRGLPGLNYAILDRQFDYHAASSTPDTLDARSLQHLGEQVLAVARVLAAAPALPPRTADPAYASVLGRFVIMYPAWAGWLIVMAGAAALALAWRRSGSPSPWRAAAAGLHLLLVLVLGLTLARLATGVPFGFTAGRPLLARWDGYEAALALLCAGGVAGWWWLALRGARWPAMALPPLLALLMLPCGGGGWIMPAVAAIAALLATPAFARPMPGRAIGMGLGLTVLLLAIAAQAGAPVAAVVTGWSLLAGALALLAAGLRRPWGPALAALIAALLVAQQAATAHLLLLAVGETTAGIAAPFALFAALLLSPLLGRALTARAAAWGAVPLLAAGVAAILVVRLGPVGSARHPAVSQVAHVSDLASGRFYRATSLATPDGWTLAALGPHRAGAPLLPLWDKAVIAPGERIVPAAPVVRRLVLRDGRVLLRIGAPAGSRALHVALATSVPLRGVRVNGIAVPLLEQAGRIDRLKWVGRDPVALLLLPRGRGRLSLRIATVRDGWPADARPLAPRPADAMPWYDSDTTVSLATSPIDR